MLASARSADKLEELTQAALALEGSIEAWPLDVTDAAAVRVAVEAMERAGPLSHAVLNAGTHKPVRAKGLSAADFEPLLRLNLMGTVNCLEPLLEAMIARREGHIAVVASVAGYRGLPTSAAYGMTKAGLINMAEALEPELKRYRVRMQIINPGFVRTPLTDQNPFPMPFLIEPEAAAEAIARGLDSRRFEIAFPWLFTRLMKLLRILPYGLFFAATRRIVPERD